MLIECKCVLSDRYSYPQPAHKQAVLRSIRWCSFISLEGADSSQASEVSTREVEASQRTLACIAACRIEDIFADSKFLRAESLHELVKAIMWAAGPIKRAVMLAEESDTAQVSHCSRCLPVQTDYKIGMQ